jgi:hypothetical protein
MVINSVVRFSIKHKENVLIISKNAKYTESFLNLKRFSYFFLQKKKNLKSFFGKKFNVIQNANDIYNISFVDTIIMINIPLKEGSILIKTFFKNPRIEKLVLIENKKNYKNLNFLTPNIIFDQLELKIISKKKHIKQEGRSNSIEEENITLIIRREKLPVSIGPGFNQLFKFFSSRMNVRMGSADKKKNFRLFTDSLTENKNPNLEKSNFSKNYYFNRINRFSEELGITTTKIKCFGLMDFLYTITLFLFH